MHRALPPPIQNWFLLQSFPLVLLVDQWCSQRGAFGAQAPPLCQLLCTYKLALDCRRHHCNSPAMYLTCHFTCSLTLFALFAC